MAKNSDDKREKKDKKEKKGKKREKKEKSDKPAASAVAKPTDAKVSEVSLEEKEDHPDDLGVDWDDPTRADGDQSHGAGPKDESEYEYTYEESDDGIKEERGRSCNKEHAKYQAGKPDEGSSSDESSSIPRIPVKGGQRAKELPRDLKAARDPAARKRSLGSAVANSHGSAVANPRKSAASSSGVAASSSRGSAVAGVAASSSHRSAVKGPSSSGSTVVSSDSVRSTRPRVNDPSANWYSPRDSFQNLSGIGSRDSRAFRNMRLHREGHPNQRDRELHSPQAAWMVDRDCPPEEIDTQIFGEGAKGSHMLFVCVDMEIGEQSIAHDYLCKLADDADASRDVCSAQHHRTSRSGPKKTVHRLGRKDETYSFVVVHNRFVSQCIYYDFKADHREEHDTLRFGTLHISLAPVEYDSMEKDLCLGVISVRKSVDTKTTFDKSDAQLLAIWTEHETHDMVIACTGRQTCAMEIWKYFGALSQARCGCPLYQPVKKPLSAVATTSSRSSSEQCACPQFVFVYGEVNKVNMPEDSQVRPCKAASIREGRWREGVVEPSEIPTWEPPPPTDLAHRQALGEISIKAIQWEKSPDKVLPLSFWVDYPSKTIVSKAATRTAKGKGRGTAKGKYQGKGNYTRTDKDNCRQGHERGRHITDDTYKDHRRHTDDERRRAHLQLLQQKRLQIEEEKHRPEPPAFPPTGTQSTTHPHRRRSPGRVGVTSSSSICGPRTPSRSPPPRAKSHSSPPRKEASRRGLLMPRAKMVRGAQYRVRSQRDDLHPHQHVPLAAPSHSPSPGVPEDPDARAAYLEAHKPAFVKGYREWMAKESARRGPHTEESICSDEDFGETEEEFATDMDHVPARVTMVSRGSSGRLPPWHANSARGQGCGRSRSHVRARPTNPPAREQRRSPDQHARPHHRAQHSRSSASVRDESPVRAFQPLHRDRSPRRPSLRKHSEASQATYVVMRANQVKLGKFE